jgi:DNA helicase HerA-like ATPase
MGEGRKSALGTLEQFKRGVSIYPHPGDPVRLADQADFEKIFAPPELPHVMFGTVYPTDSMRAPILYDRLLGRHFAILGSSGTGKSTTTSLLLQRILDAAPRGHILILDPHGEYAHAFGSRAKVWDVENLALPYWAMNLEEHCEAFVTSSADEAAVDRNILAKCLQKARARNVRISEASKVTADSPIPYQLADLILALEEEAGRLEKLADASRYTLLRLTIEQYFADQRYGFIFNGEYANNSLEQLLSEILRIPNDGQPISIIDLAGVPTELVNAVVSTIARLVLDFAIRSPRDRKVPILLMCEEAHRYLPRVPTAQTAGVRRQLERIAREGRKYGVCLGIVSQRPSELSEVVLSQCGTMLSMRLNNQDDQQQLKASMPEGARSLVGVIPALANQECIITGDGVPVPMRVHVDTVPAESKPASEDQLFSLKWKVEAAGRTELEATVRNWREAGR